MIESSSPQLASSRGRSQFLAPVGRVFFKLRDLLFPLVFFALVLASEPRLFLGSERWDRALDAFGIAVALSGQLLRAAVIGLAYIRRGGKNKQVFADALVQEGFFAHSRNPLYLGNFLALVGFCLIHNSPLCYLVGIPFFAFAYLAIVEAEEEYLGRKFGAEYEEYRRRVPRFLPTLKGLGATFNSMEFDWRRLVRKEYGSTFAGLSSIFAVLLWDESVRHGLAGVRGMLPVTLGVWAALACAYLAARYLKKTGALGTD